MKVSHSHSVHEDACQPATRAPEARISGIGKDIFEHVRNLLVCATLMALGLIARQRSEDLLGGSLLKGITGWGVIAVAAALALLNLQIGVDRLRSWKHWKLWSAVLLAGYVVIALRVLEVMTLLRVEGK